MKTSYTVLSRRPVCIYERTGQKAIYTVLSSKNYEYITEPEWSLQSSRERTIGTMWQKWNKNYQYSVLDKSYIIKYDRTRMKTVFNTVLSRELLLHLTEREWKLFCNVISKRAICTYRRTGKKTVYTVFSSKNYEYIAEPEWNQQCSRARCDRSGMKTIYRVLSSKRWQKRNENYLYSALEQELWIHYRTRVKSAVFSRKNYQHHMTEAERKPSIQCSRQEPKVGITYLEIKLFTQFSRERISATYDTTGMKRIYALEREP